MEGVLPWLPCSPCLPQHLLSQLEELYTGHKKSFSRLPSELLYGHTGYLYALLFVNSYIPGAIGDSTIEEVRGGSVREEEREEGGEGSHDSCPCR